MKRATIYARVSTREQNVDMQLIDLRGYAKARGLNVIQEYIDYGSGSKNDRKNYLKLFDDVRKRKTDIVLVWKFDRFARSTKELISALEEFRSIGVDFISFKENMDTTTHMGKILFTIISAFAEFEKAVLRERVVAGMEKARAKGIEFGRPKIPEFKIKDALEMKATGADYKEICKKLGISKSAYYKIVK
jgi:DNA invertase Pin-like site-specific DNA recombinase